MSPDEELVKLVLEAVYPLKRPKNSNRWPSKENAPKNLLFFFAEMGVIYTGPNYIKGQSDSDNFLTFWYTLLCIPLSLGGVLTHCISQLCLQPIGFWQRCPEQIWDLFDFLLLPLKWLQVVLVVPLREIRRECSCSISSDGIKTLIDISATFEL